LGEVCENNLGWRLSRNTDLCEFNVFLTVHHELTVH